MSNIELGESKNILYESLGENVGKCIISPLEPGYGITIGNAYRRVLMSSIDGYAIVYAKIAGVKHEYSTIPGVYEEVMDICLNLKQVRFKLKNDLITKNSEKINITLKDKTVFKAGDIGKFTYLFEVLNPDHIICNLHPGTNLEIEIIVEKGKGYVPSSELAASELGLGVLSLDAIFSPIRNVQFEVENTRVGSKVDYDKLIIEICTDGSIHPEDALKKASKLLISNFSLIFKNSLEYKDALEASTDIITSDELNLRKLLKRPISELADELSTRAINCLEKNNILTLGQLIETPIENIKEIKSFGSKSLDEVKRVIEKYKLISTHNRSQK